jgi:Dual specificity phosphatase, catalytic domain
MVTYSDFVEVIPGLYIGSHPEPEDPFDFGADVVVTLATDTSARATPPHGLLIHWSIKDGPIPPPEELDALVTIVHARLLTGAAVFVHCQAGMNRSALFVARVLMAHGMTAREAIDKVRERRHGSLGEEYAAWLLATPFPAPTRVNESSFSEPVGASTHGDRGSAR